MSLALSRVLPGFGSYGRILTCRLWNTTQTKPPMRTVGQTFSRLLHDGRWWTSAKYPSVADRQRHNSSTTTPSCPGLVVGNKAPSFAAQAVMPDNSFQSLTLESLLEDGKMALLLFYPLDFTFVCPTELIAFSDAVERFEQRGVEVVAISVDSHFTHLAWKKTPLEQGGVGNVKIPMVSDLDKSISRSYAVLKDNAIAYRGLFLIDNEGVVRHSLINDLPLGRSVAEAVRMVDAVQHFMKYGEVCPANWQKGSKAMKPSAEDCAEYLRKASK